MTDFVIEKMSPSHVGEIARLEKECFSTPWSDDGLKSELNNAFARFFVATYAGEIAGYVGAHNVLGEVYITNVAVFEKFRRKGVAKKLIDALLETAKAENGNFVTLEVRESNIPAVSLYEKCGFEKVGERKNFYEKPKENAVLMTYFIK